MRISLLGVEFDALTVQDVCALISDIVGYGDRRIIANHNLHSVYLVHHDSRVADFFEKSYKIHIDGMPLVYLARIFGYSVQNKHRVTYLDFIGSLMAECARRGWRVYYLGGKAGVAAKAASRLRNSFPELQIVTHDGYFEKSGHENVQVLEKIRKYRPEVLLVGMGMPIQEHWIYENFTEIEANVILTAGACFDYLAGVVPSPPRWMGRIGLEWLFRLLTEPQRLWKRYLLEPWYVAALILREIFAYGRTKML